MPRATGADGVPSCHPKINVLPTNEAMREWARAERADNNSSTSMVASIVMSPNFDDLTKRQQKTLRETYKARLNIDTLLTTFLESFERERERKWTQEK